MAEPWLLKLNERRREKERKLTRKTPTNEKGVESEGLRGWDERVLPGKWPRLPGQRTPRDHWEPGTWAGPGTAVAAGGWDVETLPRSLTRSWGTSKVCEERQ